MFASLPSTEVWLPESGVTAALFLLSNATVADPARRALLDDPRYHTRLREARVRLRAFLQEHLPRAGVPPITLHVVPAETQGTHTIPPTFFAFIEVPAINGPIGVASIKLMETFRDDMRGWCFTPMFRPTPPVSAVMEVGELKVEASLGQDGADATLDRLEGDLVNLLGQLRRSDPKLAPYLRDPPQRVERAVLEATFPVPPNLTPLGLAASGIGSLGLSDEAASAFALQPPLPFDMSTAPLPVHAREIRDQAQEQPAQAVTVAGQLVLPAGWHLEADPNLPGVQRLVPNSPAPPSAGETEAPGVLSRPRAFNDFRGGDA